MAVEHLCSALISARSVNFTASSAFFRAVAAAKIAVFPFADSLDGMVIRALLTPDQCSLLQSRRCDT
eukprot:732868-Rhodomonas_salina.1